MTDPKPSTNDILSKIRAKAAVPSEASSAAGSSAESQSESPAAPAEEKKEAASGGPKSTSDILAAARAAKASGSPPAAAPAAGAAAAAPKSPADIMAAIRAKAGAPVAPSGAASAPAKEKEKAVPADPSKAAGLTAAEMIRAARTVSEGGDPAPKVILPSKPLPSKAAVSKPAAPAEEVERRSVVAGFFAVLFSPVVIAWGSFIATLTASGLGVARFMMPNVLVEPPTRFKIGPPNDYAPGTVSTKWQAQFNIWVVNAEVDGAQQIYALSTVCTHLGCTPNWLEGEQKFKCPCHGSGFYKSGVNFEGPAPRPLERVGIRLAEDGMLEVDKSVKFQKELGQWSNPACFVGVT